MHGGIEADRLSNTIRDVVGLAPAEDLPPMAPIARSGPGGKRGKGKADGVPADLVIPEVEHRRRGAFRKYRCIERRCAGAL